MNLSGILFYVMRAARFSAVVCAVYAVARAVWLCAKKCGVDWKRELIRLMFIAYFAALTEIIALRGGVGTTRTLKLSPLATTMNQLRAGAWAFVYHSAGNMIWFVPLGAFLHRKGPLKAMLVGAGVSMALEFLQWLLMTGVTDVDDVILNALGALIGCIVWKTLNRIRKRYV